MVGLLTGKLGGSSKNRRDRTPNEACPFLGIIYVLPHDIRVRTL